MKIKVNGAGNFFKKIFRIILLSVFLTVLPKLAMALESEYVQGEVLVVLKGGEAVNPLGAGSPLGAGYPPEKISLSGKVFLSSAEGRSYVRSVAAAAEAEVPAVYEALSESSGKIIARMKSGVKSTEELIADLKKNPDVLNAVPNYVVRPRLTPNDYNASTLWNMENINAPAAWDTATGKDYVHIAVVDSGVDTSHPDLINNISGELSKNFSTDSNIIDATGHGSHVSGVIAAEGNNGTGVTGVNWKAKIIALKIFNSASQGDTGKIAEALEYLVELLKDKQFVLPVVNFSLGSWAATAPAEMKLDPYWLAFKALDDTNRAVIVVAAGNERSQAGVPAVFNYPGGMYEKGYYSYPDSFPGLDNMIVVGALDENNNAAEYTNWGSGSVHLAAPGNGIYSTFKGGSYQKISGTSMAAPHVAGAVALLASSHEDPASLSAGLLKGLICQYANSGVNPKAPATVGGYKIPPQGVPDTTISKYGLLDVNAAVNALLGENFKKVESVSITAPASGVEAGKTLNLSAALTPHDATVSAVSWSSDKPEVAAVDLNGTVKGLSAGTAVITGRALGGDAAVARVSVTVTGSAPAGSGGGGGGGGCSAGAPFLAAVFCLTVSAFQTGRKKF